MDYRSPSRERRHNSRSPTPASRYSASPSPARRRFSSRSPPPPPVEHNGSYRSETRSPSPVRGRSESRSPLRGSTKIVVEKLSKTINEEHLREIFGRYGTIRDLDLPISRQFGTNRGTAYILYVNESDAESAIAHMHEANLDGAIINVSIVLPRRKFNPSPPTASRGANIDPRMPAPGFRGGGGRGGGGRGFGFGGGRGGRSPPRHGRSGRDAFDTYRPRSYSRSRSPPSRRNRSRSKTGASPSRSPPRRRGGGRRDSYDDRGGYNERRRSPSYDSGRERSRSRSQGRSYR